MFSKGVLLYLARFPRPSLSLPVLGSFICSNDVMPSVRVWPSLRPRCPRLPRLFCLCLQRVCMLSEGLPRYPALPLPYFHLISRV